MSVTAWTARRWLQKGAARPCLWLQLGCCAALIALCGIDVLMVRAHVACDIYRATIQGLPGEIVALSSLSVGAVCCVWRLVALLRLGRYRAFAWSLGILAVEVGLLLGALTLDIERTLFYCAFDGAALNAGNLGLYVH